MLTYQILPRLRTEECLFVMKRVRFDPTDPTSIAVTDGKGRAAGAEDGNLAGRRLSTVPFLLLFPEAQKTVTRLCSHTARVPKGALG